MPSLHPLSPAQNSSLTYDWLEETLLPADWMPASVEKREKAGSSCMVGETEEYGEERERGREKKDRISGDPWLKWMETVCLWKVKRLSSTETRDFLFFFFTMLSVILGCV